MRRHLSLMLAIDGRAPMVHHMRVLVACASVVAAPALAQTFSCPELKGLLVDAERDFASLKGRQLKKESAEDVARANGVPVSTLGMNYQRLVHAATKPLSGPVTSCQVVQSSIEDRHSVTKAHAVECRYDPRSAGTRITPALQKQLHTCVGGEVDADSDSESLVIVVDRVESGEGVRSVSVEVDANAADGLSLAVRKSVCLRKLPQGCDGE